MRTIARSLSVLCVISVVASCAKHRPVNNPITTGGSAAVVIRTDKACYRPGETVGFSIDKPIPNASIRYRHLDETISETALSGNSWQWTPPAADYMGYLVDIYGQADGGEKIYASIAVDVSSDWTRFPRYGFLSSFGQLPDVHMDSVIDNLTRHHINGIQFQDWQYKHHMPLAGSVASPTTVWKDIANRDNYLETVRYYIGKAHNANMKAMFYNLAYGALNDAAVDGVKDEWYVFKDNAHSLRDRHALPKPPFKSDIFLLDPANASWQQYISDRNKDVYHVFDFDGFHADQLGERGNVYRYDGSLIDLAGGFKPFLESMKAAEPGKRLVMNAVNQYGQQNGVAQAPVDFLYTEVWGGNEGYKDLEKIINDNDSYSNHTKKTVLAAYMDYNLADNPGYFNTPGVLLTDAVIFAFGGSHLEIGEHMLGKEYFPNSNLQMKNDLKTALVKYYDFLTAYQNLLRDGGSFNSPVLTCSNGVMSLNNWPPAGSRVAVVGKEYADRQVLHLINFANASSFDWRDADGKQPEPQSFQNAILELTTGKTVSKIWVASPDINDGVAVAIPFTQTGSKVSWNLPLLKYWDMIVLEY